MSNGHSLFQWMWHCPGGYLGHNLPQKARLSLEMVDATDDIHPCGVILSFTVLGTCLPAGTRNTQSCSFPCPSPCVPMGTFPSPKPQVHRWGDIKPTYGREAPHSLSNTAQGPAGNRIHMNLKMAKCLFRMDEAGH